MYVSSTRKRATKRKTKYSNFSIKVREMIFSSLLIFVIGYGTAFWVSSTGTAYWRSIAGFMLAFTIAWLGGGYLTSVLLFPSSSEGHSMNQLIAKAMGLALISAGFGAYKGRRDLGKGKSSPLKTSSVAPSFDFFTLKMTAVGAAIGLTLVFAVPAYEDYTQRQESSNDAVSLGDFAALVPVKNASLNPAAPIANTSQPTKFASELATRLQELMSCKGYSEGLDCRLEFQGLDIEIAGVSSNRRSGGTIYVNKLGAGQVLHMQGNCIVVDFAESFPSENPFTLWVLVRNDGVIRPHSNHDFANTFCRGA
jgi:hypothetical protein